MAMVFAPNTSIALAIGGAEIQIDGFELTECDPDTIEVAFNVVVAEEGALDLVEVKKDGTILFESEHVNDPETIEFTKEALTPGSHTLTATIYNNDDKEVVLVSDTYTFDVECERSPQVIDESNAHVNINGSGGDADCCPGNGGGSSDNGSDKTSTVAKKPAVKGATTKAVSSKKSLKPLNSVFRSVFGRTPTFTEWKYWANRYLTDKPQWNALYGAMQWHKLRGHTMGA
ncbi:MAG: hypothetical protein HYZ61_03700 [Candidatus Andersenbacteria bacterium]|nr:hypothetical protein [Candidatus Andersenbacteria bacterium]